MIRLLQWMVCAALPLASTIAAGDDRIRSVAYAPDKIVRIVGKTGIQSTIEFGKDERIENVAVGDSSAWQITPNRRASLLFVKPLAARSRTNMTVVTDKRTYMFDLVAGDQSTVPVYALKFSFGEELNPEPARKSVLQVAAPPPAAAMPQLAVDKLHFDWKKSGNNKLMPTAVFDDGNTLYLSWNRSSPLPAILTRSEDRKEGPVNYQMVGEYIAISPIPPNVVLRYGSRNALLSPARRIAPQGTVPLSSGPQSVAAVAVPTGRSAAPANVPAVGFQVPQPKPSSPPLRRKVMTATHQLVDIARLYSDHLTDADNER
jgi:type IV secretion system protein VirB9